VKAKAREFHGHDALLAGRESPCRDNTIEGNVGVWLSRFWRLSCRDNGEAGAEGQPLPGAFPKPFAGVIAMFALRFAKKFRQVVRANAGIQVPRRA
jgi:hypothetical protein